MNNKLNRFTTYEYLLATLNNGLYFSDGKNWPDKNDSELLELFRKYSGKDVTVACLMEEDETIYHWKVFANDFCQQEVCCIEFDKEKLVSLYNDENNNQSDCHYYCKDVNYKSIDELCFDNPIQLLFTKRIPYRYENEFRIVCVINKDKKLPKVNTEKFKKTITRITLSGALSDEEYIQRKDYLIKEYNFTAKQINKSTVEKNPFWIGKADVQAQFLDYRDLNSRDLKNDICERHCNKGPGYTVQINKNRSPENRLNSAIVTFHSNNYVVAMGVLKYVDTNRENEINNTVNSSLTFQEPTYELSNFDIRDDYKGLIHCEEIIEEFGPFYNKNMIAVVPNSHDDFIQALEKINFKRKDSNDEFVLLVKKAISK